mmetsp:Transcript_37155/g.87093  ORF Transcript_37155/g.87093 Transcript_37155/m.87093 type:complete len:364 (-) Transcript_37155:124-1215(-)
METEASKAAPSVDEEPGQGNPSVDDGPEDMTVNEQASADGSDEQADEGAEDAGSANGVASAAGGRLSRSARKRKRQEERAEHFKATRKERRKETRARQVARKKASGPEPIRERVAPAASAPGEAAGEDQEREVVKQTRAERKAMQLEEFKKHSLEGTTVVLDLEWEDELSDKEVKGLVQQVLYCYGANRKAARPVRLVLSGVVEGSVTRERLAKLSGFDTWLCQTSEKPYIDLFEKDRLVYLTADTENIVREFDKDKVYVIGGIVDRNRLKGRTREKADEQGIATAALPLAEYIHMGQSSRVLTTNHVLDIIHEHQASGNWRSTFEKCVPGRKQFIEAADAPTEPTSEPPVEPRHAPEESAGT